MPFLRGNKYGKRFLPGDKHPNWKGGRIISSEGYILIYMPNHPYCNRNKYISEHRLVMERELRRYLTSQEEIHHINGNKLDNRIENLQLCSNKREHKEIDHPFRGKKLSKEHRRNMSLSRKGQIPWNKGKTMKRG